MAASAEAAAKPQVSQKQTEHQSLRKLMSNSDIAAKVAADAAIADAHAR